MVVCGKIQELGFGVFCYFMAMKKWYLIGDRYPLSTNVEAISIRHMVEELRAVD
jgi:hypothetical protein